MRGLRQMGKVSVAIVYGMGCRLGCNVQKIVQFYLLRLLPTSLLPTSLKSRRSRFDLSVPTASDFNEVSLDSLTAGFAI